MFRVLWLRFHNFWGSGFMVEGFGFAAQPLGLQMFSVDSA